MTDFVAHSSRSRTALMVLITTVFVVLGMWLAGILGTPPASGLYAEGLVAASGWTCMLFFGLFCTLWTKRLFEGGEQLRIGPSGIRSRSWSEQTMPWSEVKRITIWTSNGQSSIVLHLRDRTLFPGKRLLAVFAGITRKLSGGDVAISMTGTDRSLAEALAAIEQFRV